MDRIDGAYASHTNLPIFDVEKVELRFSISSSFVAAQVANNVLVLALQNNRILRIDIESPGDVDDIDLPKKPQEIGTIRRLFLDPTASHLIISTTLGENYYLHTQSKQPKALSRLKGVPIECIGWNPSQPTASTREILLGGTDGSVYETYIELGVEFYKREEKYCKKVYAAEGPVTGLWLDVLPGDVSELRRILLSTPGRLLHFVGRIGRHGHEGSGSLYARLFESESFTTHETSAGANSRSSMLAVTPEAPGTFLSMDSSTPERIFAWLSSQGVFHGKLMNAPQTPDLGRRIFSEARILPTSQLPAPSQATVGVLAEAATFVALTQWHILQLVGSRIVAHNRLDHSLVYDQVVLGSGQKALALLADLKKNTFWLFTNHDILEIVVRDEDRDLWKIMIKAQKFEEALQYASSSSQKDAVATASGDYLMSRGKYMEAAGVYGKSTKSFEQVSLSFIDEGQKDALRKYLLTKLSNMKKSAVMQRIMLVSWLTEIFMSKLNALEDMMMTKAEGENVSTSDIESQIAAVRREFQDFISKYKDDFDHKTTYDIISSHGRDEELLYFSTAINDYNYVLSHWVQRENWAEALKALSKQKEAAVTYKYASVLMTYVPVGFVDILMRQSNLEARKLIPAFLNYNDVSAGIALEKNQAVRYLLFEINQHGSMDSAVHNTLLSIYASYPSEDESSLLSYLESQSSSINITSSTSTSEILRSLPYDTDFALRLCIQHARVRSCVHIYTTMGQYASAVTLALQHNETNLAISVAERSEHDAALRKKLWLAIARNVIANATTSTSTNEDPTVANGMAKRDSSDASGEENQSTPISVALSLLHRAPAGTLRIEDLLPLLPDFIRIDALKSEICAALESYSASIDALKRDMDASAAASARMREETAKLDSRWVLLEPGEGCAVCGEVLLDRRFWMWGCGHGAHGDCTAKQVERYGSKASSMRLREVRRLVEIGGLEMKRKEALIKELDGIVGASCPLCGDLAIRILDEPFVTAEDDQSAWAL